MTELRAGQTIDTSRRALAARLRAAGIESAELDARILTGHVIELDLTGLIAAANGAVTPDQANQLDDLARRRISGEPVARLLGRKEFWGLSLTLSAATLVPRPDTETVVELALEMLALGPRPQPRLRLADIGTGSGAILLALLSELPNAYGAGTDISEPALQTARLNASRLGLAGRAGFLACDYAAALCRPFDLIVSNPPYVRSADIAGLATEVRDHDPLAALDGGADGLDAYRALIPQAARLLATRGALVVETGQGQSGDIEDLMIKAGLTLERPAKVDLAGIRRAVAGRKPPP